MTSSRGGVGGEAVTEHDRAALEELRDLIRRRTTRNAIRLPRIGLVRRAYQWIFHSDDELEWPPLPKATARIRR